MANILRKCLENHKAQFLILTVFIGQKSKLFYYYIQSDRNRIQIRVYTKNTESVTHFGQFISVKVKRILRKYQVQFWEELRTLIIRQNDGCLIKNV